MHDIVIFLWTRDEINTHSRLQTLKWRFYLALLNVSRPWKGNIQVHCIYHLEIKVDTDVFPPQLVRLRNSSTPRSHHGCSKTQDFHFVPRHFSYTLRIHKPIAVGPISPYFSSCRKRPLLMQSDLIFFERKKEMKSIQSYTKRPIHLRQMFASRNPWALKISRGDVVACLINLVPRAFPLKNGPPI